MMIAAMMIAALMRIGPKLETTKALSFSPNGVSSMSGIASKKSLLVNHTFGRVTATAKASEILLCADRQTWLGRLLNVRTDQ